MRYNLGTGEEVFLHIDWGKCDMKVTLLSSFLAVADTCNFTKAAEALFTTQPTLSRHIAMLEEELGVQLLVRDKHHVELTEAGEYLFKEGKRWMADMHAIERRISLMSISESKQIDVICSPMYSQILRTVYKKFPDRYPEVTCNIRHIESGTELDCIDQGIADLGVLFSDPSILKNHDLKYTSLTMQKLCLVCGLDSPLVETSVLTLADFKKETLLMSNHLMSPWLKNVHKELEPYFGNIIVVDNLETVNLNIANSQGIAMWPEIVVKDTQHFAKALTVRDFKPTTNLWAVWAENNTNPNIKRFIDLFKETMK